MAPVNGVRAVVNPGFSFELSAIIALVGGTVFVMWLAEQITARGIGQGASLLIFAGIIAQIPEGVAKIVSLGSVGQMSPAMIALVILFVVGIVALIAFFAYFQTAVVFNSEETSNNLRNAGGYIPGVRPGEQTVSFLDSMVSRVTAIGVLYLIVVCVLPIILNTHFGMPLMIGGTSVLIVAGVVLDTMNQVQSYLVAKQYHGVMGAAKKGRFRN